MARDGSGNYNRAVASPSAGQVISSSNYNTEMNDLGAALTASIAKDGQTTPSANLPMGGYKHTGVSTASGGVRSEYVSSAVEQDGGTHWCGTAGGTADALTLTPTPAITSYTAGLVFRFKAGAAPNTGAATVAVSGLSAKAIQKAGAALAANDIAADKWYEVLYDGAAFQLQAYTINVTGVTSVATGTGLTGGPITTTGTVDLDFTNLTAASPATGDYVAGVDISDGNNEKKFLVSDILALASAAVPSGTVMDYAGSTEPSGWLFCYGQAISRATYAALFAIVGTTYGVGDGSTTFNLPDLRGRVAAGRDDMGGAAASRVTSGGSGITGTTLGASGGTETHTLTAAQLASHTHGPGSGTAIVNIQAGGGSFAAPAGGTDWGSSAATASAGSGTAHNNTQPTFILNKIIKT